MKSDSRTTITNSVAAPAVQVARELQQPLADLARVLGQPPARIVNQALAEYLERRLRPDRERGGSASYIETTAREDRGPPRRLLASARP